MIIINFYENRKYTVIQVNTGLYGSKDWYYPESVQIRKTNLKKLANIIKISDKINWNQ